MNGDLNRLSELICGARRIRAFTGAGVSTLSGIRDFRGKDGVYLQPWHGRSVEEILSLDCFLAEPRLFYEWAREFLYRLDDFHSSVVHLTLAEMERRGLLSGVYTQNIDLLHQKAGSRAVYELHGSPATHRCLACGREFSYSEIAPRVIAGETPHCPCGGLIKPNIVFYGENLDSDLLDRAFADMEKTDLLLVLGSSLTVHPAADLPLACHYSGGKLVIVNARPTPLDKFAALRFDELESVFTSLAENLKKS